MEEKRDGRRSRERGIWRRREGEREGGWCGGNLKEGGRVRVCVY